MQRYFDKGMLAVLGLLLAVIVFNGVVAYRNIRDLYDARVRVGQSRQVQAALQEVLSTAQEAETGVRGFVITGETRYLEPYEAAIADMALQLRKVAELTTDSAQQLERVPVLEDRINQVFGELREIREARAQGGVDRARALVLTDRAKHAMDELRAQIQRMRSDELTLLDARAEASYRSMDVARASAALAVILGIFVIGVLVMQMRRSFIARDRAASVLSDQKELFRTTLASLGEAVVTCDTEGRATFLNGAAEALTGWSAARAQGLPIEDIVRVQSEARGTILESPVRRVLRDGFEVPVAHRGRILPRGGTAGHPVEDSATPILDNEGRVAGAVLVFRDITDRVRSEAALREADRRKDEFLAVLAHELRNPLAPLRNALHVVRLSNNSPESVGKVLAMMERQVQQMVRLIDDLLDVSRITRGRLELRREPVSVDEVVDAALEMSAPLIARYGHRVEVRIAPGLPTLDADRARLIQVVDNLVGNAAKYSEPGARIEIDVGLREDAVAIRVKDNGAGIPAEMLDKIFEMFTQVDRTLERSRGGLGIGLTLVRRIVELHGGRVTARSEGPGCGSEFEVTLPVGEAASRPAAQPDDEPVATPGRRVLVGDDNEDAAETLGGMLRLQGYEVRLAFDGEQCLAAFEEFRPEVALLDIGMPGLSGYEAARRIRAMAGGARVTLIALTGWGQEEDRRRARDAGFDHHLVKPADHEILAQLLAAGQRQKREAVDA